MKKWQKVTLLIATHVFVAAMCVLVTLCLCTGWLPGASEAGPGIGQSKLEELELTIDQMYIGDVDLTALEDAAAEGMVAAVGDRWSYYVPASEFSALMENKNNAYVGVGITIAVREDGQGFDILKVEPTGPAKEAGLLPGDIVIRAGGQSVMEMGLEGSRDVIRGEIGTTVDITVLRDGEELTFTVERRQIETPVATGTMLEGNIGYVKIVNFNTNCARDTIAEIEKLLEAGAESLIFDVRFNPGGYAHELVEVLDYLLPEGPLFRSVDYLGNEKVDASKEGCLEIPMAVLMNGDSYSAAEFFAAALNEYDWAVTVGEHTVGKGNFQYTLPLSDGSAVVLSVGKYYTPNGTSLADVGGLVPEVEVVVDLETAALIYSDLLDPMEDPQVLAAIEALQNP